MKKRVLIIGAGASGLTAIKCCLDEDIEPVCYERNHDIGGLWRYEENEKNGASVYKSTVINTSKEMMCFSDFPIPKEYPNYMHNSLVFKYLRMYCNEFKLEKHITYHTEVQSCKFAEDYNETGRWKVKSKNTRSSREKTEIFDGVIIAVGHHAVPNLPIKRFQGINNFKGKHLHSNSYRHEKGYEDKNILVIGTGNSGGDISVELSRVGKQVFLSTRKGAWVVKRIGDYGLPMGMLLGTRFNMWMMGMMPLNYLNSSTEAMLNKQFDHELYGMQPKHRVFSQHSLVNDELPNRILNGSMKIKGNVKCFTETGVIFDDGTFEQIDIVIFATGYNFSFPFLDRSLLNPETNNIKLYKYVWPPSLEKGTLASIGGIQPLGSTIPISEMQCRWVTRVFKGLSKLPSQEKMENDIQMKAIKIRQRYYESPRHTVQVDYIPYMDEIAQEVGVRPSIWSLVLRDPQLAYKVLFEGCSSYQFRLSGPGKWHKAREMIMTQQERMIYPLKSRTSVPRSKHSNHDYSIQIMILITLVLCYVFYF